MDALDREVRGEHRPIGSEDLNAFEGDGADRFQAPSPIMMPRPDTLIEICGWAASRRRPDFHRAKPASSRSVGRPAWLTIIGTPGLRAATLAAAAIWEG